MNVYLSLAVLLYYLMGIQSGSNRSVPIITRQPKNKTALVDHRFELHCRASGDPKPKFTWEHDRQRISIIQRHRITRAGSLRFTEIKPKDQGWYRCKAQNNRGLTFSQEAFLTVHAPVVIVDCPYQKFVPYGHQITMDCKMAGIPRPRVQWFKNGHLVPSKRLVLEKTHTFARLKVNVTADAIYTCVGSNEVIIGNRTAIRDVHVRLVPTPGLNKTGEECSPYQGSICSDYLANRKVYYNHSSSNEDHEDVVRNLLKGLAVQEKCKEPAKRFLCHFAFPDCQPGTKKPEPLPLCRESCQTVRDVYCYQEWKLLENHKRDGIYLKNRAHFRLPQCPKLPTKNSCSDVDFGKPDPTLVSSDCFKGNGRWYNGTVNTTRSGMTCQSWSSSIPHGHSRTPNLFIELQNSSNYCRNPGGEEEQPWCYTINKTLRWEACDVPQCELNGRIVTSPVGESEFPKPVLNVPIIIISIVVAAGLICLALILWRCRQVLRLSHPPVRYRYDATPQEDIEEVDIAQIPTNITYHRVGEVLKLNPRLEKLEYPRNDIIYMRDIGQGAFGRVFQAKAPGILKKENYELVAVKMLKDDASDDLKQDFEREALLMAEFSHSNIVKLLGVCAMGKPMCLLFEYMTKGDLNEFLRLYSPEKMLIRRDSTGIMSSTAIDTSNLDNIHLLIIAKQIAWGMVYLSEKGYVHRDLATRNCLVGDNLRVKISDFGLARSVNSVEYYRGSDQDAIPIRWMPVEAILYNKFTIESDVWSFGVVLWEIFSFALQPYYGMTHEEVVAFVKEGNTLSRPESTPHDVYELMLNCWSYNPSIRPPFHTTYKTLSSLLKEAEKNAKTESRAEDV